MKKIIIMIILFLGIGLLNSQAQEISVRLGFPAGVSVVAPGPPPFFGALWIGPEWAWRGGRYVVVPGYWARPRRHGIVWISGHWRDTRRGVRWEPGQWR